MPSNPNDRASSWRVGGYTYRLTSTGEEIAGFDMEDGEPTKEIVGINRTTEFELRSGEVTTQIHYTDFEIGVRSTLSISWRYF